MPVQCLGIYREKRFSPGAHAAGDAEILELTQAALERAGYQTTLIAPESLPTMPPSAPVVFSMCQSLESLAVLEAWEQHGILVLNTPAAVRACYRLALVTALSQTILPFPRSVVVPLDETKPTAVLCPALPKGTAGWWVKRGDVHAMQADDVLFVRHAADLPAQLARLRQRGIAMPSCRSISPARSGNFTRYAVMVCCTPSHRMRHTARPLIMRVSIRWPSKRVRSWAWTFMVGIV